MSSLRRQLELAEAARRAVASVEASSRTAIEEIVSQWERGDLSASTVRYRLEAAVRSAYRASAGVSYSAAQRNSGLEDWFPAVVFNTEYLQDLLEDVRRNLRAYKASAREDVDRKRLVSRVEHSAGVAAQRGYTDQTIAAYTELEDFGFQLQKVWVANFVDNTPCPACVRLHGTSVGLHESFREETNESRVYRDLLGPPRHPRCQCKIVVLIRTLENALTPLELPTAPVAPQTMTTADVQRMPRGIFRAVIAALRTVAGLFRRNR